MPDPAPQPAYVLHARPFRESSLLLDLLVLGQGRVTAVARGVRGERRSAQRALLQPLQPLQVVLLRRGELATLTRFEAASPALSARGEALLAVLYANELCIRLLPRDEPVDAVFLSYAECLAALADGASPARPLRRFEAVLLEASGYGLDLRQDAAGRPIIDTQRYWLADSGALLALAPGARPSVSGAALRSLAAGGELPAGEAAGLRRLLGARIAAVLGPRPLRSWGLLDELSGLRPGGGAQGDEAAERSTAQASSKD